MTEQTIDEGLVVSETNRLRELERENEELKKMFAEVLENQRHRKGSKRR